MTFKNADLKPGTDLNVKIKFNQHRCLEGEIKEEEEDKPEEKAIDVEAKDNTKFAKAVGNLKGLIDSRFNSFIHNIKTLVSISNHSISVN